MLAPVNSLKRVLIVDDDSADRDLVAEVVARAGHRPMPCADAERGLAVAREALPDVVVSDLLMPGGDGVDFVRRLRAELSLTVPVIFLTAAYRAEEVRDLAELLEVSRVLTKPCDPQRLVATIDELLGAGPHARLVIPPQDSLDAAGDERSRLLRALVEAEETERARIAREIHDDTLQAMYAVGLRLEHLAHSVHGDVDAEALQRTRETLEAAIRRLRALAFELHPADGDTPLGDRLRAFLTAALADSPVGWEVADDELVELPPELAVTLYRLAQEAVTNAVRHADASTIRLRLRRAGASVALEICDDGRGFVSAATIGRHARGIGLVTMRERIEIAGGTMRLDSAPGDGTTVSFRAPLPVALRSPRPAGWTLVNQPIPPSNP